MNESCDTNDLRAGEKAARGSQEPSAETTVTRVANALCDEAASSEDLVSLESALRADRAAVRQYVEIMGLHTSIDWAITSKPPTDGLVDVVSQMSGPEGGSSRRHRNQTLGKLGGALLAIGATLLLAVGLGGWSVPGLSGPDLIAAGDCATIVEHSSDARWVVLRSSETPEMRTSLAAYETVHLTSGELCMRFGDGAEVMLTSPAVFQVLARDRALAMRGRLTANVTEDAIGFSIDTPRAHVVDLGTRFGLEVDDLGQTDVIVFEGEVDIAYGPVEAQGANWTRRVMRMGEAVRVDDHGDANRIVSIESDRFASLPASRAGMPSRVSKPIISRVRDNIRDDESWNYYEIVHGGLREDALAYVDREEHEWNGEQASGMPSYLVGADYVKVFNNDKVAEDFIIEVSVDRPCRLFVLFDNRVAAPAWLQEAFRDTGDDIGLDRGPYRRILSQELVEDFAAGVGPGVSIEDTASVWECVITEPKTVRLGAVEAPTSTTNMYGIVAAPLDKDAT